MYLGFGAFCSVPLFHLIIKENFFYSDDGYSTLNSFIYYILVGLSYTTGLFIFCKKFPENLGTGKYDIWVK